MCPQGGARASVPLRSGPLDRVRAPEEAASLEDAPVGQRRQMGGAVLWELSKKRGGGEAMWADSMTRKAFVCTCAYLRAQSGEVAVAKPEGRHGR